ncbi:hypothetical protein BS50DRAFT_499549 [Corynespora cassiicola Philippines]|uniref:C2H2-type domain-containing protein n=1 Tax=Corynespora cassiicola Philippines TaxID=1448308 RepID=A0A2T2NEZ0_CORCC|nr:hypothetical protein BS50DRAFT_499549 [Corynespora cassiicola Philippines]
MLALPQRRQHFSQHPTSTLPSPPSSQPLSYDHLNNQTLYGQKLLHQYLESQQQQPYQNNLAVAGDSTQYMTGAYDFSNPTIRIQQSTPTGFSQASMLPSNPATASAIDSWNAYGAMQGSQTLQTPVQNRTGRNHQRASSSSSVASTEYQTVGPTTAYQPFSNHLPTPTHTPTQDSFMNPNSFNSSYNTGAQQAMDTTMAAHLSMKQALMDQHVPDEDVPGFAHSARHSVSSYGHDSPATPHTAQGEDYDDRFKIPPTGETPLYKVDSWLFDQFLTYDEESDLRQHTVPKFERTYTDVAADNFYDPNAMVTPAQPMPQSKSTLLSPYRSNNDLIQRSLQAAQIARSQSPSSSASRGASPFRQSPYRQPNHSFSSPRMRVGTAAHTREQNLEADAAYAMKSQMQPSEEAQPKTISPKDALLDYRDADDESKVPLFPDSGASEYDPQYNSGDQYRNATQSNFDTTSGHSYRRDSWATTPQFSPNFSTSSAGSSQPTSTFSFAPPSIPGMHGLPLTSTPHYRYTPSSMPSAPDQTPEFPAHLTSMESSASEAGPETGSQSSEHLLQKPASSNADSGTYTCTYHGCTLRFETPQKLQKHKREGHRNANAAATTIGSGMTSAALLERNSQAGPHKCERINPTTGKPCNTIFSRPYDLTRHEDTIHNARKQKVRCALCVEEKTFSRNDALTRHMRVVHPEVDFPGKHRRRGGNHD